MWLTASFVGIAFLMISGTSAGKCPKTYKKIGCFYDGAEKKNMEMLINGRNSIDWFKFHESTHTLACDCIAMARKNGFDFIRIGFYGECLGGKDFAKKILKWTRSNGCVNIKYAACVDASDHDCVGKANNGYVYKLDGGRDRDVATVNGGYSEWSEWSECSVTCGQGMKERERTCTNPLPQGELGKDCSGLGPVSQTETCKNKDCPVDGGFSEWSRFGECSTSCGPGKRTSQRTCTNPTPAHGGKDCDGNLERTEACKLKECPVDGAFTNWSDYGACSVTCGSGHQKSTRSCTNPAPAHGGEECIGDTEKTRECTMDPCPINGGVTSWSKYSECSKTCGTGTRSRKRTCTNPAPAHGGEDCKELLIESESCNVDPCPVDGGFSEWTTWDTCTATCGGGTQEATRSCTNPKPMHGGKDCDGETTKTRDCATNPCPINGQFSGWSKYGACSKTCGGGTQEKTRECNNPEPQYGGKDCVGEKSFTRECETQECPVDGGFSKWGEWGTCSNECGGGVQEKTRECNNPSPANGGKNCAGPFEMTRPCNTHECPIDGGFTAWSKYGECSKTCGGGTQSQTRKCTNPKPEHGGEGCSGPTVNTRICNSNACPIDGGVSQWTEFTECSRTCGGGTKVRRRQCNNPKPMYGGKNCEEKLFEEEPCNEDPCPINGGWTTWSLYGACSETCGSGVQTSTRSCTNPAPQHGGSECTGETTKTRACKVRECPIDGGFTEWSDYDTCSKNCGGGEQTRTRSCTNPPAQYGGAACEGPKSETKSCNTHECPIDGGFTDWSEYTTCSASCGGGTKSRTRSCTNPKPEFGGKDCVGPLKESKNCGLDPCPVDGGFSDWSAYGKCTRSCGGGIQTRTRSCNNPPPAHGGEDCDGELSETRECNTDPCPVDGKWTDWSDYGECSKTCGGGVMEAERSCTNPAPLHGGEECVGPTRNTKSCNTDPCPIDGGYGKWSEYGECSVSCGGGEKVSSRECNNPSPQHGGKECEGPSSRSETCNAQPCPIDGGLTQWTEYTACSTTCGIGKQKRTRECTNPKPQHGGKDCEGELVEEKSCNEKPCPINGGFSEWTKYGECSENCGVGSQTRRRSCNNPRPQHGGEDCDGPRSETRTCKIKPCPIDGGFTDWSEYSKCSQTCGGGIRFQTRQCTRPKPAFGGEACVGKTRREEPCNTNPCPINGGWSEYGPFGPCTKSCGGGTQTATRSCTNPRPQHGGTKCVGSTVKLRVCGMKHCPVDGSWSDWRKLGVCSKTCGGGKQTYERSCTNPAPKYGGKDCGKDKTMQSTCNSIPCPVDGGFGIWSEYTECTRTCGGGEMTRTRVCDNPRPAHGGKGCVGPTFEKQVCNPNPCPVDGGLTSWSNYGECSKTCGGGTKTRSRSCTNPPPAHGGTDCSGPLSDSADCNEHHCPVDGGFTDWSDYGECSKECGGGMHARTRKCTNPAPAYGGKGCVGSSRQEKTCNQHPCPVNGGFGEWGPFSKCSVSCGGGERSKTRQCNNPAPAHGGENCKGDTTFTESCNTNPCPVDGGFGKWGPYEKCSKTCGGGIAKRYRKCDSPKPQHGGKNCVGLPWSMKACGTRHCPVDGGWGEFTAYSKCTKTCGGGSQKRTRKCDSPAPAHGGKACSGSAMQIRICGNRHCPVDGGYTQWSAFDKCTDTCGGGTQERRRTCTKPSPAHGGKACSGPSTNSRACNIQPCPIDGGFTDWGPFDACTKSCGGGSQTSRRVCSRPKPAHGGMACEGPSSRTRACNTHPCPVNGNWGKWGPLEACSKTCGGGVQKKFRTCNNPAPAHGGKACAGKDVHIQACNPHHCPINGNWGNFGPYKACSKPCGGGTHKRFRSCSNPAPQYGGKTCPGVNFQMKACNTHHCPVNGNWGSWGRFGACSKVCGGGTQTRTRPCNNPSAAYGGRNCPGSSSNMRACNTHHCPVNGNWGSWGGFGACSKVCGGGTQTRTRPCNNPSAAYGGRNCPGSSSNMRACNTHHCPVNGNWGNWGAYEKCSKTCGGGVMHRYRKCDHPSAKYGGKACAGTPRGIAACNTHHCPVDGNWGGWGPFGACTRTCDGGIQRAFRKCDNPPAQYGGKACAGSPFKFQGCANFRCKAPVNGNWGAWSAFGPCSKPCRGIKTRTRYCNNPAPSGGGHGCAGSNQYVSVCNVACRVDGKYGAWTAWSACSKTCNGGTQSRSRPCNNPAPSNGGSNCVGPATAVQACNTQKCPVKYSTQKTSVACEHGHMSINCGHGGIIEVQYANYGRTNPHVCGHHSRTGCRASNSWSYVYSRCHNKSSCWLKSNNSEFGDPCWGTFKYLEVKYRCRGGPYAK